MIAVTTKYEKINHTCHLHQGKSWCQLSPFSPSSFWRRPAHFMAHSRCSVSVHSFFFPLFPYLPVHNPPSITCRPVRGGLGLEIERATWGLLLPRQPAWAGLALGALSCHMVINHAFSICFQVTPQKLVTPSWIFLRRQLPQVWLLLRI